MQALREIKHYQQSNELLINKAPFQRVVWQIANEFGDYCWQQFTIEALQKAMKVYLVAFFKSRAILLLISTIKLISIQILTLLPYTPSASPYKPRIWSWYAATWWTLKYLWRLSWLNQKYKGNFRQSTNVILEKSKIDFLYLSLLTILNSNAQF